MRRGFIEVWKQGFAGVLLASAGISMAADNGLQVNARTSDWGATRLQGRLTLGVHPATLYADPLVSDAPAQRLNSLSLLGDYYLTRPFGNAANGGLRATSGVLLGPRASLWGGLSGQGGFQIERRSSLSTALDTSYDAGTTVPYVGIGYTSLSLRGGWGMSVDLGLMAMRPGAFGQFGGVLSGSQSLDSTLRDLRLAPVLQLGVSYSF